MGLAVGYLFEFISFATSREYVNSSLSIRIFFFDTVVSPKSQKNTEFLPLYTLLEDLDSLIQCEVSNSFAKNLQGQIP